MSIYVTTQVWEHSKQHGSALLTMLAIADFADDHGEAYPGEDRLAKKARTGIRNLQKILKKLVISGELVIDYQNGVKTSSGQWTNRYKIQLHQLIAQAARGEQSDGSQAEGVNASTGPDTQEANAGSGLNHEGMNAGSGLEANAGSGLGGEGVNPSSPKPSVKIQPPEESSGKGSPQTPQGDVVPDDLDLMQQAVKVYLKLYGDRQTNVAKLLLNKHTGTKKKHNIGGQPATPDELAKFVADWRRIKPTLNPPAKMEAVNQWFNRWREDGLGEGPPGQGANKLDRQHQAQVDRIKQSKYAHLYANG